MAINNNLFQKLRFQLISDYSHNPSEDFTAFTNNLVATNKFIAQRANNFNNDSITISQRNTQGTIAIQRNLADNPFASINGKQPLILALEIDQQAGRLFCNFRAALHSLKKPFFLFCEQLNLPHPSNPNLISTKFGGINPNLLNSIRDFGLEPAYYLANNNVFYATDKLGAVHLINRDAHIFFSNNSPSSEDLKNERIINEFSHEVTASLMDFGFLFDRGAIPDSFYRLIQSSNPKITNHSLINVETPSEDIFIEARIFNPRALLPKPLLQQKTMGKALPIEKISSDENLDKMLTRLLKSELKIAEDYEKAIVTPQLKFDRDEKGDVKKVLAVNVLIPTSDDMTQEENLCKVNWGSLRTGDKRAEKKIIQLRSNDGNQILH